MAKKILIISGVVVFFLLASIYVYTQNEKQITQAELVNALIRALGLEEMLPLAATLSDKVRLLEELGYAPIGGWRLEALLTKGDVAVVLAQILGIPLPTGATVDDYIKELADRGIMTPGGAGQAFSLADLTSTINVAARLPGAFPSWPQKERLSQIIPPYRIPVSPTR